MGENMKKLLLLLLVATTPVAYASNLCFGFGQGLRKSGYQKVSCNCNCNQYPRSTHEDEYICTKCGHRLIPWTITTEPVFDPVIDIDPIFIDLVKLPLKKQSPFKEKQLHRYGIKKKKKPSSKTIKIVLLDQS